ncbi:MAG: helix-turn-helix domain-containing protein [Gammaproteobacteria bacterium]|nr:helix-turn-helix domain-containing protein [Gammaproteobacteria bacterium]
MSAVEFNPVDQHRFDAELSVEQLGPVRLAKLSVDRCSIERKRIHIVRNSSRLYTLLLQAKGSSTFYHCGNEARLAEGDFVLCDLGMPHVFDTKDPSVTIMVRMAPEVLREYLPTPEQFCGLHLGRTVGLASSAAAIVQNLSDNVVAGLRSGYETRVARYLLEMISMSYIATYEPVLKGSAVQWQRRNAIIRYIEDNLRDPALTATSIADGLGLSPRYVRNIFSMNGEKVLAYVLRRRLEECARQMQDPAWNGHTLTEIAYSWGFNSAAHFTRTFRDHFGVAPREYRRSAQDSQPLAASAGC